MRRPAFWLLAAPFCSIAPVAAQPARDVNAVLEQVEARGQDIEDIRCDVVYAVEDRVAADVVKRYGEIIFKRADPNPLFMIAFVKTVQDGILSRKRFWYLFDGRWFYEAQERSKSIIKRDIAPPGTKIDLFSIENAPFPIPFGQKKEQVLKHFEVAFGAGAEALENTDHLVCTPKRGSRVANDYSKLEFFVDRRLHLPRRIVMTSEDRAKVTTADFPNLSEESINVELPDSAFQLPPETKKYSVAVDE
jgi:outer membrane lipoprotein-sorting protein